MQMSQMQRRPIGIRGVLHQAWLPGLCIGAFSFIGISARAQIMNPRAIQGRENSENVFVRDSAVAVDKVFQAKHMEDLKEWDRAAEVYQDIIKNFADRMVPSDLDRTNQIYQYGSVTPLVHEKLSKWPAEGVAAYRARYETEAAAMVDTAHDNPALLHRVMTWYFITDAGKQSAMRLMDLYFEQGEFSAVAWIGQKLLAMHPVLDTDRPIILFRTALASHLAGDEERAQLQLKELTEKHGDAKALIRGTEVSLSQVLAKELAADETRLKEFSIDSWPIAFGSRDRSRIPEIGTYGGAKLFSVEIEKPRLPNGITGFQSNFTEGNMTGIIPVVDRGELFFQDNANLYALSAESGSPLPGWGQTYPGEKRGRYSIPNAWPSPRSYQSTLTLTDDSVLAIMSQPDLLASQMTNNAAAAPKLTRLVCLDRRTGKEKWVAMPSRFADNLAGLRGLDLTGSPLVVGDLVYVQARGGKGLQFEDSYVIAFELSTGKLKWNSYLASANSGQQFWNMDVASAVMAGSTTHLAYNNGRIYAQTNIGAIAAIDAYDGSIVWLDIYPREDTNRNYNIGWGRGGARNINNRLQQQVMQTTVFPWKHNPVIVSQGYVFVLPSDASNVHIYDAGTGAEVKRIPISQFGNSEIMLGVIDEKLILHGARQVYCLDWRKYRTEKPEEAKLWDSQMPSAPGAAVNFNDQQIMGRGFVTTNSVLIPTARRLVRLALEGGKVIQQYPGVEGSSWPEAEGPGNILATQDRLIVAGPSDASTMRVNVYTDLDMALARLEREIAAAPNDPGQRLRYADIVFAAGKVDLAIAKLDEAIGLLNGPARESDARDRIFNSAMTYSLKINRDPSPKSAELADALFDRAGAAAGTPGQKVEYRLARAKHSSTRMQFDLAVRYLQQILLDDAMRPVPVAGEDGNTVSAADHARKEIQTLINRAGIAIYAPYEKAAADALQNAARAGDPQQLQNISQSYPNSVAASRALILAAEVFEASGNNRVATQVLRQAFFERSGDRNLNNVERMRILEGLARNYLRLPNGLDSALARLNQAVNSTGGASRLTRPLLLPDGKTLDKMTLNQAAEALKQYRAQASSNLLPNPMLPTTAQRVPGKPLATFKPEEPGSVIPAVNRLIVPDPLYARPDRVVTFTETTGLRIFGIGNPTPVMASDAIKSMRTGGGGAWSGRSLLAWNSTDLVSLLPDANRQAWATSLKTIPPLEVVGRPGEAVQENDPLRPPPNNVIVGGPGQRPNIDNIVIFGGGRVQIQVAPVPPQPIGGRPSSEEIAHVRPLSDRVIIGTTNGRILALSLDDGRLLWQQRPGDNGFSHFCATEDFIAVRMADESADSSQIIVYDVGNGQIRTRRSFGITFGGRNPLMNIALSPDGMLLYLCAQVLYGKDLFEPGELDRPAFQFGTSPREPLNFMNATTPEHLQIFGDKVVAVSSDNAGSTAWILNLRTGTKVQFGGNDANIRLDESSNKSRIIIRGNGTSLYLATAKNVRGVNLETGDGWSYGGHGIRTDVTVRNLVVARDHLLLLADLSGRGAAPNVGRSFAMRLYAFSRALDGRGLESGLCDHDTEINTGNVTLSDYQIVDGGIYYLAGDGRLHFLRGARE